MNKLEKKLLEKISDLHTMPSGAFNIRKNGQLFDRASTKEIEITPKKNKNGINIKIKDGTKNKSVHIPVIITVGGLNDLVYNDFYIGKDCDVLIVAGCGIHNATCKTSLHSGIHSFHVGQNSKVRYVEKHIAEGKSGDKILNPITKIVLQKNSFMQIETLQLDGVTSSLRKTIARLGEGATLKVQENISTSEQQWTKTYFKVLLAGRDSRAEIVSHSVAKGRSFQEFKSNLIGQELCFGHVECDGIMMDEARIVSVPMIDAQNSNSSLIHEAAIGKIASDELIKLMSLGLSKEEAENMIIEGFLLG